MQVPGICIILQLFVVRRIAPDHFSILFYPERRITNEISILMFFSLCQAVTRHESKENPATLVFCRSKRPAFA
jgi:hypothetical protein